MEGQTHQKETSPIVYVLGTLVVIGLILGSYLLGMRNPLNLSIGDTPTIKPTQTARPTPTIEPVQGIYDEVQMPTITSTPAATTKATLKPISTINPNIFYIPTATPVATLKPVLKTIAPIQF